ncbi:Endonuclease/exonuclease/phosphatase [Dichotomocladium elegans]|nr:Endonuclease/exonuclease/phosphatase [Dichotomocladium elegans]
MVRDNHPHSEYIVIKTDQLVGLFSCVFIKADEVKRVSLVESTVVKTGLKLMHKSIHGNKGGIAIRFRLDDSSLCFVNCHLAAGQTHIQQRNSDAEGILQTAGFHSSDVDVVNNSTGGSNNSVFCNGGDGSMILDHEHCFLSGDLNYRINMTRERVLQLLANHEDPSQCLLALQKEDQLLKQRVINPLFRLLIFDEPQINFLPTYKYDPGTDFYDRSEKKRVPAWCDRILYRSKCAHNLFYQRHEVLASDHRPISSGFIIKIKQMDRHRRQDVAHHVDGEWRAHYQKLVEASKIAYVTNYGALDEHQARKELETADWDVSSVIDRFSTL